MGHPLFIYVNLDFRYKILEMKYSQLIITIHDQSTDEKYDASD